ncbi:MAG: 50S ribosomal protein L15 [Lentisphaerae bacterium]|nr:50S ribosomal protein L15 [Lentisphaerota bacterium]
MNLHTLKNVPGARHRKMRVGCGPGSGKGKTCGRGHKGQYARSGHKHKPGFEGGQMRLLRRIPKRGFNRPDKRRYRLVALTSLNRFKDGREVTSAVLEEAGLIESGAWGVKVLGGGELKKKLTVKAQAFSVAARQAITAAGGTAEVIR